MLVQWLRPEGQICGLNRSVNLKYEQLQWRMWETHTGTFQAFSSARPLRSSCPIWSKSVRHGHKVNTHAHTHTFPFFSWESGLHEGLVGDKLRSRAHGCSVFSHCSWGSFSLCSDDVNQYLNLFRWWICVLWQLYFAVTTLSSVYYQERGHLKMGQTNTRNLK